MNANTSAPKAPPHQKSRRHNIESDNDEQQPQPPSLMGGDGSHGPGVLVSTEQPRREENVDDETVTLQLQHPSSNDDNPILCSVVCNRRTIRASSTLIRNLLDNMGRDDEVLPPFSTEHIADELTLRRVLEFVTDVEPTIPDGHLTEGPFMQCCLVEKDSAHAVKHLIVRPIRARDFCDSIQQLFRKFVQSDGHRGGILKMFVAAHYLGCEKLKNATAAYLAMAINAWCESGDSIPIFGGIPNQFEVDGDPMGNISLGVLAEITNLLVNDVAEWEVLLQFSPHLFKSIARVERIWENGGLHNWDKAQFNDPTCHICLAMEQRLEFSPDGDFDDLCMVFSHEVTSYHTRWSQLVDTLALLYAKKAVVNPEVTVDWCHSIQPDLSAARCVLLSTLVKIWQLNPNGLLVVPSLPPGGVDAIADCWKEYYHFATHKATAISVELNPETEDPKTLDVRQLVYILQRTTHLQSLHLRSKGRSTSTAVRVPSVLHSMMELAMIQRVSLDGRCPALLHALPTSVKILEIGCIQNTNFTDIIAPTLLQQPDLMDGMEALIFDCGGTTSIETVCKEHHYHLHKLHSRCSQNNKVLRVFLRNPAALSTRDFSSASLLRRHIEFCIFSVDDGVWERMPSEPQPEGEQWAVVEDPPFVEWHA